ncbi:FACT complex subunit-domain-containing protein [Lentinula raphanica]|nr:FACT complex subunit-domain-containing protein [Lentinula raphanica]
MPSKNDEGEFTYLRINFQTPGQVAGRNEDTPFEAPDATFVRSITYRTELKRDVNKREAQKKEMADVVEQDSLIDLKGRRPAKMPEAFIRPAADGKRLPGEVETHQNGVRDQSPMGHKVDVLFSNIKHLFFQPCDHEPPTAPSDVADTESEYEPESDGSEQSSASDDENEISNASGMPVHTGVIYELDEIVPPLKKAKMDDAALLKRVKTLEEAQHKGWTTIARRDVVKVYRYHSAGHQARIVQAERIAKLASLQARRLYTKRPRLRMQAAEVRGDEESSAQAPAGADLTDDGPDDSIGEPQELHSPFHILSFEGVPFHPPYLAVIFLLSHMSGIPSMAMSILHVYSRFIAHLFACPEYPPTSTQS